MVVNLFVGFADHHRLNGWQEFCDDQGRKPKGRPELQGRTHVPTEDSATAHPACNANLSAKPLDEVPDLPALKCAWRMQAARAFRANRGTSRAIFTAPAEFPVGESGQTFFSASSISAPAMYLV